MLRNSKKYINKHERCLKLQAAVSRLKVKVCNKTIRKRLSKNGTFGSVVGNEFLFL